jgi:antitoxin component YwqK of YwqJK toxin-antitoxin module
MAVPFMRDREEARRYTASYRAVRKANPASLSAALELGLINGRQAVEELFDTASGSVQTRALDRDLIVTVNRMLGSEDDRAQLKRNLLQFSGVITEDEDHDGIIEAWTSYRNGMLTEYRYDADQDGEAELTITFAQGLPAQAEIVLALEENSGRVSPLAEGSRTSPDRSPRRTALLRWERYPAVLDTELDGKRYIPRPLDYFFTPIRFVPLVSGGPDYPGREDILPVLTERGLLSFSYILEQPSVEFSGGTERIELSGGIPVKSTVYLKGKKVSETEFQQGRPFIQYLDLDADGRMETVRRFDKEGLVSSESDWDGDGTYEYAEIRQSDGSMKKFWDFDKDGIRETEHD